MVKLRIVTEFKLWHWQLLCGIVIWVRSVAVEALDSVWTLQLATVIMTVLDGKFLLAKHFYGQIPLRRDEGNQHLDIDQNNVLKFKVKTMCVCCSVLSFLTLTLRLFNKNASIIISKIIK